MSGSSPACRKMARAASSSSRQSCGLCSRRDERNTIDFRKPATSARWCSSGLSRKAGVVPRARNDSELHETLATGVRPGWMPRQHSARSAPLGRPHVRVGGRDGTCRDEAERTQDAERVPTPQHHQRIGSQRGRREAGCGESSQYRDSCPQRRAWRCSNCAVLLGNLVAGGATSGTCSCGEGRRKARAELFGRRGRSQSRGLHAIPPHVLTVGAASHFPSCFSNINCRYSWQYR